MFANFGSKVTIVGRSPLLKNEDEDIAKSVKDALNVQGIEILEGCEIESLKDNALNSNKIMKIGSSRLMRS